MVKGSGKETLNPQPETLDPELRSNFHARP